MPAYRRAPEEDKDRALVTRHLGIVSQVALRYWRFLPPRARSWYGAEDMIADVAMHVHEKRKRYDRTKARESTWVHHVAENCCRSILSHHQAHRYADAETVAATPELTRHLKAASTLERREAADAVERVINAATDAAADLLGAVLDGRVARGAFDRFLDYVERDRAVADELRDAARRCGARREDFELVLRYAVR